MLVLLLYVSGYGWSCMLQEAVRSTEDPWLWNERAAVMRRMSAPQIGDTPLHYEIVRRGDAPNSGYVVDNKSDANYFADIHAECTPKYWHYREVRDQ